MLKQCEGIVLRTIDYGESSKIITLYTRELGKVAVMAKGVKKHNNTSFAVVQPLYHATYHILIGQGMGTLRRGEKINDYRNVTGDIVRSAYALYCAELIDKGTEENKPSSSIFSVLLHILKHLNLGYDCEILRFIFEIQILELYGVKPILGRCVSCHSSKGRFSLSLREGGVLCSVCEHLDKYRIPLSHTIHKLLYLFSQIDVGRLGEVTLSAKSRKEISLIINLYYEKNVAVHFKTKYFLRQISKFTEEYS